MTDYEDIRELLYLPADRGVEFIPQTGATLIGRAPEIAPMAWSNQIYAPVSETQVQELDEQIRGRKTDVKIPGPYREFLTGFSNGLSVFNDALSLYGYRYNYIRDLIWVWQPYNIVDPNTFEKPDNASRDAVFIGSYGNDISNLYMDPDGKVHYCKRRDATSLRVWPTLHEMLLEEITRLNALYETIGPKISESEKNLPSY